MGRRKTVDRQPSPASASGVPMMCTDYTRIACSVVMLGCGDFVVMEDDSAYWVGRSPEGAVVCLMMVDGGQGF